MKIARPLLGIMKDLVHIIGRYKVKSWAKAFYKPISNPTHFRRYMHALVF